MKSRKAAKLKLSPTPARPRVMVVDDDPDVREVLSMLLAKDGFEAIAAESGARCLELIPAVRPAVILLDLMMPEMDGFEVCRALKQNPTTAEIPVIVVTARDDNASRMRAARLGASDFLVKPVSSAYLMSRLKAQLELVETMNRTRETLEKLAASKSTRSKTPSQSRVAATQAKQRQRG